MALFNSMRVKAKIVFVLTTIIILFSVAVIFTLNSTTSINSSVEMMYKVNLISVDYLIEADRDLYQSSIALSHLLNKGNSTDDSKELTSDVKDNLKQVGDRFKKAEVLWEKTGEDKTSDFAVFHKNYDILAEETGKLLSLLENGNIKEAHTRYFNEYAKPFSLVRGSMDNLTGIFLSGAEDEYKKSTATAETIFSISLTILVVCIGFAIFFSFLLTRMTKPLSDMTQVAAELAKGNIEQEIDIDSRDEIGELGDALSQLIEAQQQKAYVAKQIANGKLDVTVDIQSTKDVLGNAMRDMKDAIQKLITAMDTMSQEHDKGDIDSTIPAQEFKGAFKTMAQGVNTMVDGHIAVSNKAMACVTEFGKGNFDAPLERFPGKKANINDTIEAVRGNIKRFIANMETMSREHDAGDIEVKIPEGAFQGDFRTMASGVNKMVDGHIAVIKKSMACVDAFGQGNFDAPLEKFPGKKAFINDTIERVRNNLKEISLELGELIKSSENGQLSIRGNATKFKGDWAKLVAGVNQILNLVLDPVNESAQVLEQLSNYNLCARMHGSYKGDHAKIKESLNATAKALHDSMVQVADASEQLATASNQIARSSQQVAEGTSEQASSLEETSSSLEEMAGMTKQNADNTFQAKSLSENTKNAADDGANAMTNMMASMGKIKGAAEGTAAIIKDINEIAFQTNLLALNAAVEAARAGDAGRGFAVVAEEVRNLAGRAKDAAKNTETLIKESVSLAEEGENISIKVNDNLSDIVISVGKVTDIVSEITVASQEQSKGIEQVNRAVAEMDRVVQQSAANAEQSSSSAEELSSQAQTLATMVSKFQLTQNNPSMSSHKQFLLPQEPEKEMGGENNSWS